MDKPTSVILADGVTVAPGERCFYHTEDDAVGETVVAFLQPDRDPFAAPLPSTGRPEPLVVTPEGTWPARRLWGTRATAAASLLATLARHVAYHDKQLRHYAAALDRLRVEPIPDAEGGSDAA